MQEITAQSRCRFQTSETTSSKTLLNNSHTCFNSLGQISHTNISSPHLFHTAHGVNRAVANIYRNNRAGVVCVDCMCKKWTVANEGRYTRMLLSKMNAFNHLKKSDISAGILQELSTLENNFSLLLFCQIMHCQDLQTFHVKLTCNNFHDKHEASSFQLTLTTLQVFCTYCNMLLLINAL